MSRITTLISLSSLARMAVAMNHFNFMLRQRSQKNVRKRPISCIEYLEFVKANILAAAVPLSCAFLHPITRHAHPTRLQSTSNEIKTLLPTTSGQLYTREEIVKKSRFIGLATPCSTWEEAQLHLERVRKEHPKSRHVCFGFVSGGSEHGVGTERCSDDGEPTGTAVRSGLFIA
jgi:hypothetical protein